MSNYGSTFTGYAPGRFNPDTSNTPTDKTPFMDVAYNIDDPNDIRFILEDDPDNTRHRFDRPEARELAIRLLVAIDTPHHIVKELLTLQANEPGITPDKDL